LETGYCFQKVGEIVGPIVIGVQQEQPLVAPPAITAASINAEALTPGL
jgi:hypothetical protein